MRGPTAALALDGGTIAKYLESKTETAVQGFPKRNRTFINKKEMTTDDRRVIRRWATGKTATKASFVKLLDRYNLTLRSYKAWCKKAGVPVTLRGEL